MDAMDPQRKPKLGLHSKWTRIHQLLRDNRGLRYFVIALGAIITVGIGLLVWLWTMPEPVAVPQQLIPKKKVAPKFYSPLTGIEVADEAATKRRVTAIMLENSPDSRPQSGLKDAGVVFEAVAEGGITRFIAMYQESQPGLIGPVRSVRPYYVEWAAGFDPAVAHIGGSKRALDMIRSGKYGVDLDQFFNAATYWRATDRYAPHNVYTNFERLNALEDKKDKRESAFKFSPRVDEKKSAEPNAKTINMAVSSGSYMVDYDYDAASNSYVRKQGGANHTDREAGQIQPKVVIAIRVKMTLGFEDGYREQIETGGSGQAYIFQNGTVTEGTWSKENPQSQLKFTDGSGAEIKLARGQTWITAVPSDRNISWQ
jgi:hypothetical protein